MTRGVSMVAGRPPVPNERKRKLGNPGRRALPDVASVTAVEGVQTAAPTHLGPEGQRMYERVTAGAAWLAETDGPTLELLCEKLDRLADFRALLAESSAVLYTDKGYAYAHPVVGMISTTETEISKLFSMLGLSPTDRTRMGLAEVKARNAFEEMLAKRSARE
jgi:P27 family predicted phage terminase small subunit